MSKKLIYPISAEKEVSYVRKRLYWEAERKARELAEFFTVVKTMNLGLIDERLDTPRDTLLIVEELCKYKNLLNEFYIPYVNVTPDNEGYAPIFFEV